MNIIARLIEREGGFSKNPKDKAHQKRLAKGDRWDSYATNYGITQETLSDYFGRQATRSEVRDLTKEKAHKIYQDLYFLKPKIDQLPLPLQEVVFDMAVNAGVRRAVLLLQELLIDAGYEIIADGMIGENTIFAATRAVDKFEGYLVNAYVEERLNFYSELIAKDASQQVFAKGWKRRALSFLVAGFGEEVSMNLSLTLSEAVS